MTHCSAQPWIPAGRGVGSGVDVDDAAVEATGMIASSARPSRLAPLAPLAPLSRFPLGACGALCLAACTSTSTPAPSTPAPSTSTSQAEHGAHHGGHGGDHGDQHSVDHKSHQMNHRFDDAAAWAQRFDAPERDGWQKPEAVIAALHIPVDAVVADVGAGTGYFAVRLARAVPGAKVVGFDVEPDMVRYLNARAAQEGLANLTSKAIPTDDAAVDDGTDVVLLVDTWHHIADRVAWLRSVAPRLSARARVAVVDFKVESERGPPAAHKLAPEAVIAEFQAAGFVLDPRVDSRPAILPDQYVLLFARAAPASAPR